MSAFYDSGWVPAASGAISRAIDTGGRDWYQLVIASSGTNPPTVSANWIAGGGTIVPVFKGNPPYLTSPLPTGPLSVAAPTANGANSYYFAAGASGTNWLGPPYSLIGITATAGAASWVRVIMDGK